MACVSDIPLDEPVRVSEVDGCLQLARDSLSLLQENIGRLERRLVPVLTGDYVTDAPTEQPKDRPMYSPLGESINRLDTSICNVNDRLAKLLSLLAI